MAPRRSPQGRNAGRRVPAPRISEEERRRTILRAAVDVFARKGYHGCRISDVAKEAQVAYGLVYHYFRNKEELLQSVFELAWGGFVTRVQEVAQSNIPVAVQVRRICELAFDAYQVDPRGVRVILLEIARSPVGAQVNRQSAFAQIIGIGREMFERGVQRGDIREGLAPKLCAALMFGAVEMGLTAFITGVMDAEEASQVLRAREQLAESLLRGMLSPDALAAASLSPAPSALRMKTARRS